MLDERAAGGKLMEAASFTCASCQRVTEIDPLRKRPMNMCARCDRYLCDRCDPRACRHTKARFQKLQEQHFLNEQKNRWL